MRTLEQLFPAIARGQISRVEAQREYIRMRLVELIEADDGKSFYLTECLAQQPAVSDLVAQVILGHGVADGKFKEGKPVDRAIAMHTIRIRSLDYWTEYYETNPDTGRPVLKRKKTKSTVNWKLPADAVAPMSKPSSAAAAVEAGIFAHTNAPTFSKADRVQDTGSYEADLPLSDAVYCLRGYGKHVRRARSKRLKESRWRFEEVHPSELLGDDEPKRKPGRPRKVTADGA